MVCQRNALRHREWRSSDLQEMIIMIRTIGASALALGAVFSLNGIASAGDDSPGKSSLSTTMTLGGHGSAAQAAAADDTELTGGHGGHGGGGHGGYHGGGYHGGGFHGGYG